MIRALQIVAVLALLALVLRNLPGDSGPTETPVSNAPQYVATGARWQRFDANGDVAVAATAERLMGFSGGEKALIGLRIDQLGGEDVWSLQAPSGHQAAEDQPLRLDAPVTGTLQRPGAAPATLEAQSLWIDKARQQLFSDEAVTWVDGDSRARAQGFDGDWAGRSVRLRGDVNVRFARPQN